MRVKLFTHWSNTYSQLMTITVPNKVEYCLKHGYDFTMMHHTTTDYSIFKRERESFMLEGLKSCDWLLFLGSDTLITNMTKRVEDIVGGYPDSDLIIGVDVNGINNDVMFIRNCPGSFGYFEKIKEMLSYCEYDQTGMIKLGDSYPNFKISRVHQKLFNAMPYWLYSYADSKGGSWEEGDFILHAPGLSLDVRYNLMKNTLDKVKH